METNKYQVLLRLFCGLAPTMTQVSGHSSCYLFSSPQCPPSTVSSGAPFPIKTVIENSAFYKGMHCSLFERNLTTIAKGTQPGGSPK